MSPKLLVSWKLIAVSHARSTCANLTESGLVTNSFVAIEILLKKGHDRAYYFYATLFFNAPFS